MEQSAELAFVDHRDSRRDPPRTRESLSSSNRPAPSLLAEAVPAPVRREPGLRRTAISAPVSRQRGGSRAGPALQSRSLLASSDTLSVREFVQFLIIGAFVLLSPVLALLAAIAIEIAIDILLQARRPALPACMTAGVIGWLLLRMVWRRPGGAPVET
jgi:hypothetical protein